jgi:RNA polymerase sigma-54 factor
MVLTPQLRQRIEMLQMTSVELNELIEQELVANPILEEVQPGEEEQEFSENILDQNSDGEESLFVNGSELGTENNFDPIPEYDEFQVLDPLLNGSDSRIPTESETVDTSSDESADAFEEIDFGREFQDYLDPGYKTQEVEYKEDAPSFEQFLTRGPSLSEHLEWQLGLLDISNVLETACVNIFGNLDDDGRLSAELGDIAAVSQCSVETAERSRQIVMSLEPIGCGALDVHECLLVQLHAMGETDSLSCTLVRDHLEDLQPHRLQHLAKLTGEDVHVLDRELTKIRMLDPFPGRRFTGEAATYVVPEVYIEKIDDEYVIYFSDEGNPRLRISNTYHKLLEQTDTSKEAKDFIKEKMRSAIDLLRNIEHRRQTIYRVVDCIVRRQREFLDHGVQFLKPMMLKDVAEDIGMHLSTISRVVNRKYAYTPQGVIEIRRFFSEGMMNEDGEEVSTRILKLSIKKMIEDEDSKKPLTDEEIVKLLNKDGVKLSRRTIAKYRDQMNIPGSRERKTVV